MYNMGEPGEPGETASIHIINANHSLPYVRNYLKILSNGRRRAKNERFA